MVLTSLAFDLSASSQLKAAGSGLAPGTNPASGLIDRSGTLRSWASRNRNQSFSRPRFAPARWPARRRVRRLYQPLEHIESGSLDAVAEHEPVAARETFDRWDQPQDQAVVALQGRTGRPGVVGSGGSSAGSRMPVTTGYRIRVCEDNAQRGASPFGPPRIEVTA